MNLVTGWLCATVRHVVRTMQLSASSFCLIRLTAKNFTSLTSFGQWDHWYSSYISDRQRSMLVDCRSECRSSHGTYLFLLREFVLRVQGAGTSSPERLDSEFPLIQGCARKAKHSNCVVIEEFVTSSSGACRTYGPPFAVVSNHVSGAGEKSSVEGI